MSGSLQGAFEHYVGLGPGRSYQAVADHFRVAKRTVSRLAAREEWTERLAKVEAEARDRSDRRAVDVLGEMNERHLKISRALQNKALKALAALPLESTRDVLRALELGVKQERLVRGEPTERQASVEEVTRQEIRELLVSTGDDEDPEG